MSAAQAGDLEAVQLLSMFGANPHIVDRVCMTPTNQWVIHNCIYAHTGWCYCCRNC